ncbi:MAG TPA: zinc-dependent metalloprotease family protein [Thermodesulfobacteriota bacterium]|nr:zinc-dependent metalloprotease family protein [Thermodesulfobacteriota bacterium]
MINEKTINSMKLLFFIIITFLLHLACGSSEVKPPMISNELFLEVQEEDIIEELPEILKAESEEIVRRRFAQFNFKYFESKVLKPYEESGKAESITMDLFDDVRLTVSTIDVEKKDEETFVWKGRPEAEFYGRALLSFKRYTVFGVIQVDSMVYEIMPVSDNIVSITEIDQRKYPEEAPPIIPEKKRGKRPYKPEDSPPRDSEPDEPARNNITALVVLPIPSYSIFCDGWFPFFDILDLLEASFEESLNDVFNAVNPTGVTATVEVVCYRYDPEGGDLTDDLDWVSTDSGIANLRDENRADLVSLIVSDGDFCGRGYENFPVEAADETFAFTVVKGSCALGNFSMAHEMGHNMGMRHDRIADDASGSDTCNYGHIFPVEVGFFDFKARTVMAYGSSCGDCPRMGLYSMPVSIDVGIVEIGPMGVNCGAAPSDGNYVRANNRQQLIDAAPVVSNFR